MAECDRPRSGYPLTADLSGVLEAARQQRADDVRQFLGWLFRLGRLTSWRPAAEKALDSAAPFR